MRYPTKRLNNISISGLSDRGIKSLLQTGQKDNYQIAVIKNRIIPEISKGNIR